MCSIFNFTKNECEMKTNLAREREKGSNNVTANKVSNVVCHLNCFFFSFIQRIFSCVDSSDDYDCALSQ